MKLREKQQKELQSELKVKATPIKENNINNTVQQKESGVFDAILKKQPEDPQYPELIEIEIKKKKKNNLYGEFQSDQPELRDYN